ncbi:MAG: PTS lactose/cellobiose transporter subunit IIA [Clostridia bacterium]|nr:PTS lactose/cellobiose transporter subunit IIA [Clostridia bacterium]
MAQITEEQLEEKIFMIITMAGDAKSSFYEAFAKLKEGNYEEADALVKQGDNIMSKAHDAQTDLIAEETNGNKVPVGLFMVHAQDHLMNAILVREMLDMLMSMQKSINSLKQDDELAFI